jgi:hypothetical protein
VSGVDQMMRARELAERLKDPDAFLMRTDLEKLGLNRRAVDAVFRALPVVQFPGYSRPFVKVRDYLALIEQSTYADDRVRPCRDTSVIPLERKRAQVQSCSSPGRTTRA